VTEEEIQIVKLQTLQRVPACLEDMFTRKAQVVGSLAAPEDLAGNYETITPPAHLLDHVAHYDLSVSSSVSLCAVEKVDPSIVCRRHALEGDLFTYLSTVCDPGVQRQLTDLQTRATKTTIVHRNIVRVVAVLM
jgi:hypothetical protein